MFVIKTNVRRGTENAIRPADHNWTRHVFSTLDGCRFSFQHAELLRTADRAISCRQIILLERMIVRAERLAERARQNGLVQGSTLVVSQDRCLKMAVVSALVPHRLSTTSPHHLSFLNHDTSFALPQHFFGAPMSSEAVLRSRHRV